MNNPLLRNRGGQPYFWFVALALFYLALVGGGYVLARLIIGLVRPL